MKSNTLIKDLYINHVGSGSGTRMSYLLNDRIDQNTKLLNKVINFKHKRKLEILCNDYKELNLIETERAFSRGFAYATQLLSEAFNHKD